MTRRPASTPRPGRLLLRLATLLLVATTGTVPALAATAKDLYTAALTQERELRAPADESPSLAQLRGAIAAYKEIVRQYPRSGYSDNALWQSAGLAIQAFGLYRQPADRDAGVGFLRALEREYPLSSLVSRIVDRLQQLTRLAGPVHIRGIDRERLADVVRVTITLDEEVRYDFERLDGPARVFFDFHTTYAPPPLYNATLPFDDGDIVREIRLGQHPGQTTRVVLDIEGVDTYSVYSLYDPYRLVVDTVPITSRQARRAIPAERLSLTGLGVTPTLDHGPRAGAGDTGSPPTDRPDAPSPIEPRPTDLAQPSERAANLPPVPGGWHARRLDPIPPPLGPAAVDLGVTERAVPTYAAAGELAWPVVHNVLHSNLGSLPRTGTDSEVPPVADTEPPAEPGFVTLPHTLHAVALVPPGFPASVVEALPPPPDTRTVQTVLQAPAPSLTPFEPAAVEVVAESSGYPAVGRGTEAAFANADGDLSLGRQLGLGVSRIVIDPGHGGYDPGAQTGALTEAALVLDVARRLEARLTQTGIEVVMTRRRDTYVPLHARTELANRVGADLFLSIHANAAGDRSVRGVETYYLDLATDPTAQILAARENASSPGGMHDLPQLVRSITTHNKLDESRAFAAMVQRNLIDAVRELHPGAQDLGVKQAPFIVLIGANMPSVLSEISFLSNREDASFLATDAYRDQIAEALFLSIVGYQQTLNPSASFAAGNNN